MAPPAANKINPRHWMTGKASWTPGVAPDPTVDAGVVAAAVTVAMDLVDVVWAAVGMVDAPFVLKTLLVSVSELMPVLVKNRPVLESIAVDTPTADVDVDGELP